MDCKALLWEGAYSVAKPLAATSPSQPLVFTVSASQVAEGLDLAVQRLKQGDCAMVTCVPSLAYGDEGISPDVPPKAHVIYELLVRDVSAGAGEAAATGPALLLLRSPSSAK
jgi:hypothetical protein